ncbi:unnamed protein product [Eruca vesicaria subsp. sativa]|uniref:Uncharacterized protein n=1 Tax=Eruca vesicaria subsp. sativa TaxID=29727 RepID=A0ABC8LZ90_ERUVS|nr:unnamed protein product [Eruca vesicaria subsp. sativa]
MRTVIATARMRGEYPERIGQPECETGTYKFGVTCKFDHPRNKAGIAGQVSLNIRQPDTVNLRPLVNSTILGLNQQPTSWFLLQANNSLILGQEHLLFQALDGKIPLATHH